MAGQSTGVSGLLRRPLPYLLGLLLIVAGIQYFRPLPAVAATPILPPSERLGTPAVLPWPSTGEAAITVSGVSEVQSAGGATPVPMASTAKIMTALIILEDHPLLLDQPGPVLTVTRADVATYINERNQNESVLPVAVGEQLSEYQLVQGLMLPSASNFASMLAAWDLGGEPAFIGRMNARAAELKMASTRYADVSGFSPATVSIPSDLVIVAETAMRLPVFAQIVSQAQATLPVAGVIHNLDTLLGQNGVVGIKTGHTDRAGGCFVFAADFSIDGRPVRVYGAVLGQPNALAGAFAATAVLLSAFRATLHVRTVVRRGDVAAHYSTAWGESGPIVAAQSVDWLLVDGAPITRQTSIDALRAGAQTGAPIGTLTMRSGGRRVDVPLILEATIGGPDLGWRLFRGF